uniref:Uncharacterized protein n=1 Tax=Hucho hucho TaxID=62062 RepID=A0A4W5L613_9TELE
ISGASSLGQTTAHAHVGDELYPINLLTEEMRTDETETRIRSMRRLRTVAQALGPDRTRSELLPFLSRTATSTMRARL